MPCATSPSAMACTSSGCMPQKSAICSKERPVLSINQTAVALGIRGKDRDNIPYKGARGAIPLAGLAARCGDNHSPAGDKLNLRAVWNPHHLQVKIVP